MSPKLSDKAAGALDVECVALNVNCWGAQCQIYGVDRLRDLSGRGTARAEDAQGPPTQSHIAPSTLVYENKFPVCGAECR